MKQIDGKENMKIILSVRELAAMAGIAKEFNDIVNPNENKESVQQMVTKLIDRLNEDPKKYGFCSIKLNFQMNIVLECEVDAVCRLLDIFKDFVSAMYPLYKAAFESSTTFANRIKEVTDEYKEPDKEEDHSTPTAVVIVAGGKVPVEETFEDKFARQQEEISAYGRTKQSRKKKTAKKELFKCPECGRKASLNPEMRRHQCRNCGNEMRIQ